jgi:hypothetical protein
VSGAPGGTTTIELTPAESVLLLSCRPYLRPEEDTRLERLLRGTVEWDYVLWRAEAYRILPAVWYHVRRLGLDGTLPEHVRTYLESWSGISERRSEVLLRELGAVTGALERAGLEYFLIKGTALAASLYPTPSMRPMLDLDVVIKPHAVREARTAMRSLGYQHALWDADTDAMTVLPPHRIAEYREQHYELPAFMKRVAAPVSVPAELVPASWRRKHLKCHLRGDGTATFAVFVDLHLNLSFDFDLADVWSGVRHERILGRDLPVQSATGMVWFLAARLYHEAYQLNSFKLSMLGDLHTVLHCRGDAVDWQEVVGVAEKYGMQPSLFYILSHVRSMTGAPVPDEVLEALRPERLGLPQTHDWGDVMPKILSRTVVFDLVMAGGGSPG